MTQRSGNPDGARTRVMITDDHPVVREGFAAMIETEPDMTVVGQARSGEEALELFRRVRPDVTLMDLRMPGMGGVEAIRRSAGSSRTAASSS